jgi:Uncharacterized protein conserved in bacteria (DUF2252)
MRRPGSLVALAACAQDLADAAGSRHRPPSSFPREETLAPSPSAPGRSPSTGQDNCRRPTERQLRDAKVKFDVENFGKGELILFADWCGHSLALAHARSGDPSVIRGYLGRSDTFDRALTAFAVAYADQNEKDYAELKRAIRSGKIKAD